MNLNDISFHDGYLVSVALGGAAAVLGLKQVDGSLFSLALGGLEALSIDGLREENIILSLSSVTGREPSTEDLAGMELSEVMEILFPGPHPAADAQYHERHARFLVDKLNRVVGGDAALIQLVPAFGADLFAYCASAELQALPAPKVG